MLVFVAALAATLLSVGFIAVRWSRRRRSRLRVIPRILPDPAPGEFVVELTPRGTDRPLVIRSVSAPLDDVRRLGLGTPVGFVPVEMAEPAEDGGAQADEGRLVWRPSVPAVLRPGGIYLLGLPVGRYDGPGSLRVEILPHQAPDRMFLRFEVPVFRPSDPRARAFNEEWAARDGG